MVVGGGDGVGGGVVVGDGGPAHHDAVDMMIKMIQVIMV